MTCPRRDQDSGGGRCQSEILSRSTWRFVKMLHRQTARRRLAHIPAITLDLKITPQYQTNYVRHRLGTAMLFEEYVGRLIARALTDTGLTVSLQGGDYSA